MHDIYIFGSSLRIRATLILWGASKLLVFIRFSYSIVNCVPISCISSYIEMKTVANNWNLFPYLLIHPNNLIKIIPILFPLITTFSLAELSSTTQLDQSKWKRAEFNSMFGLELNYVVFNASIYFCISKFKSCLPVTPCIESYIFFKYIFCIQSPPYENLNRRSDGNFTYSGPTLETLKWISKRFSFT